MENFSSPQKQPGPGRYRPVKPHLTACWSPIGDQCLPGKSWRYSLNLLSKIPESPSGLAEIYHLAGEFYITTLLGYQTDRQTGVIRVRVKPSQHSFSYFQSSLPCSAHLSSDKNKIAMFRPSIRREYEKASHSQLMRAGKRSRQAPS